MKKIKILGIVSTIFIILIMAVLAVLAAFGFFSYETDPEGKTEIILNPIENKNPEYAWQISETGGDITAVIKTSAGDIEIKLADCAAAEKFIGLDNSGAFENAEFITLAENMFIQTGTYGESFPLEQNGFACINGAVGFVMEGENAAPSLVIITAKELSGNSSAFIEKSALDKEKAKLYEEFGGMPEYEGKIAVFGMVLSGTEVIESIASGETSGYTGGYSALEPVKIISVEISYPTEIN